MTEDAEFYVTQDFRILEMAMSVTINCGVVFNIAIKIL